ncbi:NAD(P)H-dependent flavin oxidoreductase [Gracilibacillus alcaliphilus]|uniref:NAD(P)H-dependent flavin oxidoreductase n=1 Tax=Gracilibacillus alcaliphilus TaxID=1401441 RepID=UPI00195BFBA2|nr:nitronate monooxygenase [Gracilibacillus alcaliphilus]MBM7675285.1 nitronate monooxygenase [Gracilibacillus alcaliphilus]
MWNENELTQKLGITYPIIQAGMAGGVTTPELVAAVSEAGGLGTLGAGYMSPSQIREAIRQIRQLTDKPFGVNLFIPETPDIVDTEVDRANDRLRSFREALAISEIPTVEKISTAVFEKQINVLVEEHVPSCSFTFGILPKKFIQQLKEKNIVMIGTATTVEEAKINQENGMDMVVMQGSEAGGHRGTFTGAFEEAMIGTMALIPQTVDQVNIPVIAAGGISDGRGVLAALVLGAQGVQIGTAFLTSIESGVNKQHKEMVLHSKEDELTVTSVFSGKPARGIRNEFIQQMEKYQKDLPPYPIQHTLTQGIRSEAAKQHRPEWMSLWCGQNPRLCKQQPAGKLMETLVRQVENKIEKARLLSSSHNNG